MKVGELNWIVNWIEMKYWWLNWIVNWVLMQWASRRIEFELNPNTLSESELSRESKKAESLHLCLCEYCRRYRSLCKSQIRTLFSIIRNLMSKIYLYVWGLGFRVWGFGFGVWGFGVWGWGLGVGVWGCGWWVGGLYVHTLVKNLLIKFLMMLFLVAKGCEFDSCLPRNYLLDLIFCYFQNLKSSYYAFKSCDDSVSDNLNSKFCLF